MKALAILVLASGVAHAGDETADTRSEAKAFWLSAGATAGAYAAVGVGVLTHSSSTIEAGAMASGIAPSLGEWYAGQFWTAGMTIRVTGGLLAAAGVVEAISHDEKVDRGNGLLVAGAVLYGAGSLWDIATARRAARAYNREHAVTVAPAPLSRGAGMFVSGRF